MIDEPTSEISAGFVKADPGSSETDRSLKLKTEIPRILPARQP